MHNDTDGEPATHRPAHKTKRGGTNPKHHGHKGVSPPSRVPPPTTQDQQQSPALSIVPAFAGDVGAPTNCVILIDSPAKPKKKKKAGGSSSCSASISGYGSDCGSSTLPSSPSHNSSAAASGGGNDSDTDFFLSLPPLFSSPCSSSTPAPHIPPPPPPSQNIEPHTPPAYLPQLTSPTSPVNSSATPIIASTSPLGVLRHSQSPNSLSLSTSLPQQSYDSNVDNSVPTEPSPKRNCVGLSVVSLENVTVTHKSPTQCRPTTPPRRVPSDPSICDSHVVCDREVLNLLVSHLHTETEKISMISDYFLLLHKREQEKRDSDIMRANESYNRAVRELDEIKSQILSRIQNKTTCPISQPAPVLTVCQPSFSAPIAQSFTDDNYFVPNCEPRTDPLPSAPQMRDTTLALQGTRSEIGTQQPSDQQAPAIQQPPTSQQQPDATAVTQQPMPNFSGMSLAELKQHAAQYGIRAGTKQFMVSTLEKVWTKCATKTNP